MSEQERVKNPAFPKFFQQQKISASCSEKVLSLGLIKLRLYLAGVFRYLAGVFR
jgi:hypothetical protein